MLRVPLRYERAVFARAVIREKLCWVVAAAVRKHESMAMRQTVVGAVSPRATALVVSSR